MYSFSIVFLESRLIQHKTAGEPNFPCLQRHFSHGPYTTGHCKSRVAIVLPPSSWPWLQFWSRRPRQPLAQTGYYNGINSLKKTGNPLALAPLLRGRSYLWRISPLRSHFYLRAFPLSTLIFFRTLSRCWPPWL